jgi:Ca2+-binding EF-hand superfamily protein
MEFITKWRTDVTKWTVSTAASIAAALNKKEEVSDLSDEQLEELRMISNFSLKEIRRLRREFLRITEGSDRITRQQFWGIPCIAVNPLRDRVAIIFGFPDEDAKDIHGSEDEDTDGKDVKDGDLKRTSDDLAEQLQRTKARGGDMGKENGKEKDKDMGAGEKKDGKDGALKPASAEGADSIPGSAAKGVGGTGPAGTAPTSAGGTATPDLRQASDDSASVDLPFQSTLDFPSFLTGVSLFNAPGKLDGKLRVAFRIHDFDGDNFISREDMTQYMRRVTKPDFESELEQVIEEVFHECASDARKQKLSFADFQRVLISTDFHVKLRLPI